MKTITNAIKEADSVIIDGCWMCLKYRQAGIYRKLQVFALILDLDEDSVIEEAPKDESGRVLDKETRTIIHDALIIRSKELN
jgi:hypothetical protein